MNAIRTLFVMTALSLCAVSPQRAFAQDPAPPTPPTQKPAQVDTQRALAKIQAAVEAQDFSTAETQARALVDADPGSFDGWFFLGYALHAQGKFQEALPAHLEAAKSPRRATSSVAHYNAGCAYALAGEKDKAIEQLTLAVDQKVSADAQFDGDPDLATLASDPRFVALVERHRGGKPAAKRAPSAAEPQTIAYSSDRRGSRIVWFGANGAAQMHLDWSPVEWKDEFAKAYDSGKLDGKRWRFGKDFWTTFDINVPVRVGGATIPAGAWFLTLERRDGKVFLQFHDSAKMRASKLDAFVADRLPRPELEAEMEVGRGDATTPKLELELKPGETALTATFDVKFGPFHLTAPIDAREE
jgi:hypothetical protein